MTSRALAFSGPLLFSAGSLFLSVTVQQTSENPTSFANFAFLQVLLGTCSNFINGIATIPLTRLHALDNLRSGVRKQLLTTIAFISFFLGIVVLTIISTITRFEVAMIFMLCVTYSIRWALRGMLLASNRRTVPAISDMIFFLTVTIGISGFAYLRSANYDSMLFVFFLAIILSCFSYVAFVVEILKEKSETSILSVFRMENAWSLFTVVVTDIAANAHSYLINVFLGPSAFAPVALASLIARPVGVLLTAAIQLERAKLYKLAVSNMFSELNKYIIRFTLTLSLVVILYSAAAVFILSDFRDEILRGQYDFHFVLICFFLISTVSLAKIFREPIVEALQAVKGYKEIAFVTFSFSAISIAVVASLLVVTMLPVSALIGLAFAQTAFTIFGLVLYRRVFL